RSSRVQVAVSSALFGRMAGGQLFCVGGHQLDWFAGAAVLRRGISICAARSVRRGGDHALAADQGRQGAVIGSPFLLTICSKVLTARFNVPSPTCLPATAGKRPRQIGAQRFVGAKCNKRGLESWNCKNLP